MLSRLDKQKIQSITIKPLLSQLPGRYMFTVFYLNTSLRCIRRLQSAGQQRSLKTQEAQLMLTTGSTRLAVSRGQQTWYHSTCYI